MVITVSVSLALEDRGDWTLEDPITRWLPGFPSGEILLWHCLTHCSGLPAYRPFYEQAEGAAAIRRLVYAVPPERPLGEAVCYSDLNFMLLGWAAARCAGQPLERAAHARARGAFTIAVTNEPASELAAAADEVLLVAAGPERAIAATVRQRRERFTFTPSAERSAAASVAPLRSPRGRRRRGR